MWKKYQQTEKGQAIVLLIIAMVGLLGFVGLALDGGNLYTEQRRAQAAADNAALAAAFTYSGRKGVTETAAAFETRAMQSALNSAAANGYVSSEVTYHHPPTSGAYTGNTAYVEVIISKTVPTILIHLVYRGPVALTVRSVAYSKQGGPPVNGNAISALNPHDCGIVQVNGAAGGGITTTGGGIFANSDGSECTGVGNSVLDCGGGSIITSQDPYHIETVATTAAADTCVSPQPVTGVPPFPQDPLADLGVPPCTGTPQNSPSGDANLTPGVYHTLDIRGTVNLAPGIYCVIDGGNNVVDMSPAGRLLGNGVVLYIPTGEVNLQQGTLQIRAPNVLYNPECADNDNPLRRDPSSVCYYLGIVFYMGRTNPSGGISLQGNVDWLVDGTVYSVSPANAVTLAGNANWTLNGQVLADHVVNSGGARVTVNFDPGLVFNPPPTVILSE